MYVLPCHGDGLGLRRGLRTKVCDLEVTSVTIGLLGFFVTLRPVSRQEGTDGVRQTPYQCKAAEQQFGCLSSVWTAAGCPSASLPV